MIPRVVAKNSTYKKSRMEPSFQLSLPVEKKYHRNKLAIREKMTRSEKTTMFTLKGVPTSAGATNVTPRIRVMFMKQLPTMLPKAKAECPVRKLLMLVENSGKLVPIAMIVAPIRDFGTPANSAIVEAESTMNRSWLRRLRRLRR